MRLLVDEAIWEFMNKHINHDKYRESLKIPDGEVSSGFSTVSLHFQPRNDEKYYIFLSKSFSFLKTKNSKSSN